MEILQGVGQSVQSEGREQTPQDSPHFRHWPQVQGSQGHPHIRSIGCTFRVPHSYPQVWEFSRMTHRIHYAYDYSFLEIMYSKRIQIKTSQRKSRLGWILGGSQKGCFRHPQGHVTHPAPACGRLRRALPHREIDPGSWVFTGAPLHRCWVASLVELHFQPPPLWRLGW